MIKEDRNHIYINNLTDLGISKNNELSMFGNKSNIYNYNSNEIIKLFETGKSNNNLEILKEITKLNLNSFITPNKFIFLLNKYCGYSMNYFKSELLIESAENTDFLTLLNNLKNIDTDIETLSINNIQIKDLNSFNILYNEENNLLKITDLDEYKFNNNINIDLVDYNFNELNIEFYIALCGCFDREEYVLNKEVLLEMRNFIVSKSSLKSSYKTFIKLKEYLENKYNKELKTVSDFRKVLRK